MATGTKSHYFGIENIKKGTLPIKTIDNAINMQNFILQKLKTILTNNEDERKSLTTIIVTGGGPSDVEVDSVFAKMRKFFKKIILN